MPRYDGTGPQGQGPLTGRGEGYCAVRIPDDGSGVYGVAARQSRPVGAAGANRPWARVRSWFARGLALGVGRGAGRAGGRGRGYRGRGRGMAGGRGRRSGRW
jgi:hypothetical protein